jgi:chorismate synthase
VYTKDGVFQCAHTKRGWEGNNPPSADTDVVEVRISFAKLGLNAKTGTQFGIGFDMTDATGDDKQRWFFWPRGATLESPKSWGDAVLE